MKRNQTLILVSEFFTYTTNVKTRLIELGYVFLLVFTFTFFSSCKDQEKIETLKHQKKYIDNNIKTLDAEIKNLNDSIDLNKSKLHIEEQHVQAINDSVRDFIYESPMATAYIRRFDKQPILILQKYFEAKTDDELKGLLFVDFVLLLYADNEESRRTITMVREGLQGFDQRTRNSINNSQYIQSKNNAITNEINSKMNQKQAFQHSIDSLDTEITMEENKGIL